MNRQDRKNASNILRRGYADHPHVRYFEHTDINGIKYRVLEHRRPLKGEYYLAPSGIKRKWIVKLAQNDFAKNYFTIVYLTQ